jgi:hypothetical protein
VPNHILRLPFDFEPDALVRDLRTCETHAWTPHFNTRDYSGAWTSISLRSASGEATDILSHPEQNGYRDTPLLALCPAFSAVLARFECEKESVRLLNLAPAAHIKEHSDVHAGYQYGFFRVHIPLQTSEHVRFEVGGEALAMRAGECWYADFSQPHSVENNGTLARVNLVLDCKRNAWSDRIFLQAGYDFEAEARAKRPDKETRAKMIAELAAMKTETAERLIRQLLDEAQ